MLFLNTAYGRGQFLQFVEKFLPDFSKEERVFNIEDKSIKVISLGKSKDLKLNVLEFNIKEEDSAKRIATTQKAFKIMRKHSIRNSLIAFSYGDGDWRLSLLTSTLKLDDNGKVISEESNPRRYSYLLGAHAKTKTPYDFLIKKGPVTDFNDLLSRFSVEVVNKQFYNSIAELFMKLVGGERNKTLYEGQLQIHGQVGPTQTKQEFAVRLIGRIVFCWFLKEKHSLNGVPLISDDILSEAAVSGNSNYYHSILEPLFFGLLNTPVNMRPESLRTDHFANIPYLNGGLFAPQGTDFYNQNDFTGGGTPGVVTIPDSWFNELFEIFGQYNFTVDENTSYDVDLSIDPEMLGRIFENLLAEINPQTGETARKSTGSFYTPREIVDYMVDNSLLYYLKDKTKVPKTKLKALISYGKEDDEEYPLDDDERQQIIDALDTLTILDPACGSGAFPIGILQKVVYVLQQVDENGELWFERQIKNIPSIEIQNDLKNKFQNENFDYIRKLGVIRQSIFGVDIQTIATEIAKLRCFLTLIIEEDINDNEPNRGVHPLPNLDFKFVTANSLVDLPGEGKNIDNNQGSLLENVNHIAELKKIRDEYFAAPSERRGYLREKFHNLQQDMFMTRIDSLAGNVTVKYDRLMRWKPFQNEPSDWFSSEWMFGVEKFDIVIANPPYVDSEFMVKNMTNERTLYAEKYNVAKGNWDLYVIFFELGFRLLNKNGILCYISPNQWLTLNYGKALREFVAPHLIGLCDMRNIADFESASVNTFITLIEKNTNEPEVNFEYFYKNKERRVTKLPRKELPKYQNNFGILVSENIDILNKLAQFTKTIDNFYTINNTFYTKEYYELTPIIQEGHLNDGSLKLINTGTMDTLFSTKWGFRKMTHDRKKFLSPVVSKESFANAFPKKISMQCSDKLIISQSSGIKIYLDEAGEFLADKVLMVIRQKGLLPLKALGFILDSELMRWYYGQLYSTGGMMGTTINDRALQNIPLPEESVIRDFIKKFGCVDGTNYEKYYGEINDYIFDMYNITDSEKKKILS